MLDRRPVFGNEPPGDESVIKMLRLALAGGGVGYGVSKLIGKIIVPAIKPSDKSVETFLQNGVLFDWIRRLPATSSKRSHSNGQPAVYGRRSTSSKTAQTKG